MKKLLIGTVLAAVGLLALTRSLTTRAGALNGDTTLLTATLVGFQEPPAIASSASGDFSGKLSPDGNSIDYVLSYAGFQTDVFVAHIHLGLPSVNGGITVFLCGGDGKPDCPPREGAVAGTITADNVRAIAAQRLVSGDLPKLLEAINAGATYVNVHSGDLPGGEIRGQIKVVENNKND